MVRSIPPIGQSIPTDEKDYTTSQLEVYHMILYYAYQYDTIWSCIPPINMQVKTDPLQWVKFAQFIVDLDFSYLLKTLAVLEQTTCSAISQFREAFRKFPIFLRCNLTESWFLKSLYFCNNDQIQFERSLLFNNDEEKQIR